MGVERPYGERPVTVLHMPQFGTPRAVHEQRDETFGLALCRSMAVAHRLIVV